MPSLAFTSTKWTLDIATKLIKADVRLHNAEAIQDDMSVLFVVNHFTRLETLLLPYVIYKNTGMEVWSLADAALFQGRLGAYLENAGALSTQHPDRDKVIIHDLLQGIKPWLIFPEGQMIKDKKVVGPSGNYWVFNPGGRRAPHTGAAALALQTEFLRHKLRCMQEDGDDENVKKILEHYNVLSLDGVFDKRTMIVPTNVTYFPIRARDNIILKLSRAFARDLSKRAIEELSVEGTIVSKDTDIDITLGTPIDVARYLETPDSEELMECGDDYEKIQRATKDVFHDLGQGLMEHYMTAIYRLVRVNYDHIFATIIRHQRAKRFTERAYRNRIFLSVYEILQRGHPAVHGLLARTYRDVIYEDFSEKFHDFMDLCLKEGLLDRHGDYYVKNFKLRRGESEFHQARTEELTYVIANEIEPLTIVSSRIKHIANMPRRALSEKVRDIFIAEDFGMYEEDYAVAHTEESHSVDVGRPFLLYPDKGFRAGIVLVHGYLAAPLEVRALAEYLREKGYLVYGVRLKGHGTSPEDLAKTKWEEWYESFNRGYAIVKSFTDDIILGGFSTGGCLALLGAARKGRKIECVFSVNAPLQLRSYAARLAPSVVSMSSLIKRVRRSSDLWQFVANDPENPHINYNRNPLTGVSELGELMGECEQALPKIEAPAYVIQASKDPVVAPSSGQQIFDAIGTPYKEYTVLERARHGIVNGDGSRDVFDRVHRFLMWAEAKADTDYPLRPVAPESQPA